MDLFLSIAEEEKEWTINDIGKNSISEIHNNPNDPNKLLNSQKQINYDLSALPSTSIRKVKKIEFQKYTKSIENEYETYIDNTYKRNEIEIENSLVKRKSNERNDIDSSISNQLNSTIPDIFFEKDFNLENPIIFDKVCENVNITSDVITDMSTNNNLQEKLSNYLDAVEINLMLEISKKRDSFFSALSSLKTLYKEIEDCVDQIQTLKVKLKDVLKCETQKGLEVVCMKRKRVNLENLYNGIRLLSEIWQTQPTIQILLGQNDYIGALGLIEETNNAMKGYNYQSSNYNPNNKSNNERNNNFAINSPSSLRSPISILSSNTYANSNNTFPLDLRGVKGLKNINGQLMEMSKAIEMMMQNEFVQILMEDIFNMGRYESESTSEKLKNNDREYSNESLISDPDDKPLIIFKTLIKNNIDVIPDTKELIVTEEMLYTKLTPIIFGLLRTNKFLRAFTSFKSEIQTKLTDVIKTKFSSLYEIPPSIAVKIKSESLTEENMALNKIKNLQFQEYYDLLENYYLYIISLLRRTFIIKCLINDIIDQAEKKNIAIGMINEENSTIITNNNNNKNNSLYINTDRSLLENKYKSNNKSMFDYNRIKKEFLTLIHQIYDIYYHESSKLLITRAEKNSQLSSINFQRLYKINTEFITVCENITKRSFLTLKSNLLSQAKIYISTFHNKKIRKIVNDIETDQWIPAEIKENNQDIVNRITHKEWGSIAELNTFDSLSSLSSSQNSSSENIDKTNNKRPINRTLYIEKKKYIVVACTVSFINALSEYITCAEVIPILIIDVINSIYSLLQVFNSKVCQIIIGGGAVTSGGLKYIAAKHLALASRSLGAVKALIPHIKNFLQSKLLTKQLILLNDLDRYSKDYDNHQREIYDKLISIMNGKLESHCKSLQAMDWEQPEIPTKPNVYMLLMVKDLTSLYRLLSKIIPIEILQDIMKEVLTSYTNRLEKELGTIEIYSSNAKNRLLIDFQYYIQKLSILDGVNGPGNKLEVVVNNIAIKEKKPTIEQKTIVNEYIRQSFDSGSRRSSIYDDNSSNGHSYTNLPQISTKNEDSQIENEKLISSPLNIGENTENNNTESENHSVVNLSQDKLNLENNNEIISVRNENNGQINNKYNNSLNQSVSINNDKEERSTCSTYHIATENINIHHSYNNNNSSNEITTTLNTLELEENSNPNKKYNGDSDSNNSFSPEYRNNDIIENSLYNRKNSYTEEKNSGTTERKSSYTINKKAFSLFSQNVKKFGSEIKKHYSSSNNSMESVLGLDKLVSKSNSSKSIISNPEISNNPPNSNE